MRSCHQQSSAGLQDRRQQRRLQRRLHSAQAALLRRAVRVGMEAQLWLFTGRLHLTHALSAHMSLQSGGPECNLARQLVAGMLDKGFSMTR